MRLVVANFVISGMARASLILAFERLTELVTGSIKC